MKMGRLLYDLEKADEVGPSSTGCWLGKEISFLFLVLFNCREGERERDDYEIQIIKTG
jgi:hypothetical protein